MVDAARDLFVEQGYARTTISEIARAADVAPQTVYWAFGSKAGLVREIRDAWFASARTSERMGEVLAIDDLSTGKESRVPAGVPLAHGSVLDRGFLTAGTLTCALHLSRFDLENGEPLDPPAELPLAVYEVVLVDGRVTIDVGDGPLEVNEDA